MGALVTRPADWDVRLWAYIDAAQAQPFAWGTHDCATWVAGWGREVTGEDHAAAWRGRYDTEVGAVRMIRRAGYRDMAQWVSEICGDPLAHRLMAQRGDVALVEGALGIVTGGQVALLGPQGLAFRPLTDAALAWRIG